MAQIAKRFGITDRTVERWASEEGWAAERKGRSLPNEPVAVAAEVLPPEPKPKPIARRRTGEIDELTIIDTAITDISAAMGGGGGDEDGVDLRSLSSGASGLCRLIELRRKLQPKTAADFAEQLLALGISPSEFVAELKARWLKEV